MARWRRIDPATNRVTFTTDLEEFGFLPFIAFGGGAAWTASDEVGKVWRVDPSGRDTEYDVGFGARALAPLDGTMWVAVQDAGKLVGIDMTTGARREIVLGHLLLGLAAHDGQLMVSIDSTPEEQIAALEGSVLTIAAPFNPFFPSPDPPANASFEFRQTGYVTCAGLLRYADLEGPEGWELVPEVAADMPTITEDGLTYTFTIREGFAFSPPSTEPLTAETFRYTIERALSPRMEAGYSSQFLADIEGAEAYITGEAPNLSGLTASGNTLTIVLVEPAPDFLNRLTLPYFCPVPVGTPAKPGGLDIVPPLSSAGPYYMTDHYGGELLILMQNPNYHGDRPRPFDAIAWRIGFTSAEVIGRVESGRADAGVASAFEPLLNAQSDRASTWGPGSDNATAGDQRWFGSPRFGLEFLYLNPARLFADQDIRRAVALAIDREQLASWFGEQPFGELLPPSVPGSDSDATVPAPDVEGARSLMAGRTGTITYARFVDCPSCTGVAETIAANLSEIGITVEIRDVETFDEILDNANEIDMFNGFLDTDFPDPVSLLGNISDTDWIGETNLDELDRIRGLSGQERIDAAAAFATDVSNEQAFANSLRIPDIPDVPRRERRVRLRPACDRCRRPIEPLSGTRLNHRNSRRLSTCCLFARWRGHACARLGHVHPARSAAGAASLTPRSDAMSVCAAAAGWSLASPRVTRARSSDIVLALVGRARKATHRRSPTARPFRAPS